MAKKFKLRNLKALEPLNLVLNEPKELFIHQVNTGVMLTIEKEDETHLTYPMEDNGLRGLAIDTGKYSFTLKDNHVLVKSV